MLIVTLDKSSLIDLYKCLEDGKSRRQIGHGWVTFG